MTLTELNNLLINNLTRVGSNRITGPEILQACQAIVSYFATQIANIIPDWDDELEFNIDGTGAGAYCKFADDNGIKRIFESKTNGNENNAPPSDPDVHENTYWLEVSASESAAIPEWAPGVYGPGLIIVFHNHSTDGRGLYVLLEPSRPFNSANIETEITALKWELISGGVGGGGSQDLFSVLGISNDAGGLQIVNLANPTNAQDADTKAARDTAVAAAIAALKASVPVAGDTLNKLYNLIVDLGALVGGWNTASLPTTGSGASSAIDKGDYWRITGTITIAGIGDLKAGDMLIASVANASVAADFFAVQSNVDLATASVLGLVKLAQDLLASATDAAVSQAAMVTALALKAPVANPTFTGTPAAPTATEGTNTTQLATTAFVKTAVESMSELSSGFGDGFGDSSY